MIGSVRDFTDFSYHQHDVICNQKYADTLPYSFHLKMVKAQASKFMYLAMLPRGVGNPIMGYEKDHENLLRESLVLMGCAGHDLIEDARLSYNDIKERAGVDVAEIIFLCTEMRGRNRAERKNDQFYKELATNELAVFVKLCDIMANSTYSILSNSGMLRKQKEEWPHIKEALKEYTFGKFRIMTGYLDKLYDL